MMKSTSDIAKECGAYESCVAETLILEESMFEAFRKAVEADFVSRCERFYVHEHKDELLPELYTLPTITE